MCQPFYASNFDYEQQLKTIFLLTLKPGIMRRTLFYFLFLLSTALTISSSYSSGNENSRIRFKSNETISPAKDMFSYPTEAYINTSMGYICVEFSANLGDTQVCIIDQFNSVVSSTICSANTGTTVYINTPQDSGFYTITITSNIYSGFGNFTIQ